MSITGGGNLYPNWLGSATLTIPNNQVVINGKIVNLIPTVDLDNHSITSVQANTKTLVWTLPGTYDAGNYFINAEFQTSNGAGGNTVYTGGDGLDWTVQGIGDASPDYAEGTTQPFYNCINGAGTGVANAVGTCRITPSGITQISVSGTQIGVYVKYLRAAAGTVTMTFSVVTFCIQKIG